MVVKTSVDVFETFRNMHAAAQSMTKIVKQNPSRHFPEFLLLSIQHPALDQSFLGDLRWSLLGGFSPREDVDILVFFWTHLKLILFDVPRFKELCLPLLFKEKLNGNN